MNYFLINKFEADIASDYLNENIGDFESLRLLENNEGEIKKELINYENKIKYFIYVKSKNDKDEKERNKGIGKRNHQQPFK
ncbi:hypothetical protein [Photobacterium leiognathi]|uniref:hypothetical protein n=1 Tax=Photobacterium leiognathi TaxID=553611 RepID=UPI0027326A60|nr:hypothetical protein [Photobacterium leiognathi]